MTSEDFEKLTVYERVMVDELRKLRVAVEEIRGIWRDMVEKDRM